MELFDLVMGLVALRLFVLRFVVCFGCGWFSVWWLVGGFGWCVDCV